jgi:hypothetical protein
MAGRKEGWIDGWREERTDGLMDGGKEGRIDGRIGKNFNFVFSLSFAQVTEIIQRCCDVYFVNLSICTEAVAGRKILKHWSRIPGFNANLFKITVEIIFNILT